MDIVIAILDSLQLSLKNKTADVMGCFMCTAYT
jgi:hypothetical protein